MYNEVITLIAETETVDSYGDTVVVETSRQIFTRLKSIGQSEFYQAQAVGLKPELKFVIADYLDYQGEKKLQYTDFNNNTETYEILRTYRQNNTLEIVVKRGVD